LWLCSVFFCFSFTIYYVFELWSSVFHLFQFAGVAFNSIFYLT
jgi:hypothetical protein